MISLYKDIIWEADLSDFFECDLINDLSRYGVIAIKRDENCRLSVRLEGEPAELYRQSRLGFPIKSQTDFNGEIDVWDSSKNISGKLGGLYLPSQTWGTNVFAEGEIDSFSYKHNSRKTPPKYKKYWYLNGVDSREFGYDQSQTIEFNHKIKLSSGSQVDEFSRRATASTGASAINLQYGSKPFTFGCIKSKAIGVRLASYILIDVENDFSAAELELLPYFLTYALGKTLVPIGHSIFDEHFFVLEAVLKSSHIPDLGHLLNARAFNPIPLRNRGRYGFALDVKGDLNRLLELFAKSSELYSLNKIVDYISVSYLLPIGVQVQPLASAFDLLRSAWFRSGKSSSGGVYMDQVRYQALIADLLHALESGLAGLDYREKILRKINRANYLGGNEQIPIFFQEIDLVLNEIELKAIHDRNMFVHGFVKDVEFQVLLQSVGTFVNVLNRAILRIIGYEGRYIDYSNRDELPLLLDEGSAG